MSSGKKLLKKKKKEVELKVDEVSEEGKEILKKLDKFHGNLLD